MRLPLVNISRVPDFCKNIWSTSIIWLELLPDMSIWRYLLQGLNIVVLPLLQLVLALKKHGSVGMHGSKIKVASLALFGVMEQSGIAKSTLVGTGHNIWGVLKEEVIQDS
jgi:hypothetical protein